MFAAFNFRRKAQENVMFPPPVAVSLTLCEYVFVEEGGTRRVSLIGSFTKLRVESFPATPSFHVFVALSDGLGDATITIIVNRLAVNEDIYVRHTPIHFDNKLKVSRLYFPVRQCTSPAAGWYQFTLLVDGEWVAHCRLEVFQIEEES
jgi:hypothetical protein